MNAAGGETRPDWSPPPVGRLSLGEFEVHVWRLTLDPPGETLSRFEPTLDDDERRRHRRFRTAPLRRRFLAGRGALRAVLAAYLGQAPADIVFAYGDHGKPRLAGVDPAGLSFNLTHTTEVALCAVTLGRTVGVDVEGVRPLDNAEKIIDRFFSPREQTEFLSLPESERLAAFYRGWSRKEAFLKATGTGLSTELDSFDVTLSPELPARLLRVGTDPEEPGRWTLLDLDVGPGFASALVLAGAPPGGFLLKLWDGLPPDLETGPVVGTAPDA